MQVLITISSDVPEVKWNAIRFGNFLLEKGEDVTIFLNGPAVDLYRGDSQLFRVREQAKIFALSDGLLYA